MGSVINWYLLQLAFVLVFVVFSPFGMSTLLISVKYSMRISSASSLDCVLLRW